MDRCASAVLLKMFWSNLIVITLCVTIAAADANCEVQPAYVRARTDAGWLRGLVRIAEDGSEYASFRGVPYGKPPVGDRRFKELEPMDPWEGDWDATKSGSSCPQKNIIYGGMSLFTAGMSEDCMYANIHVPREHLPEEGCSQSAGQPIVVMIHGGAFNTGSGDTDLHGPEYLMTKDVIVISFNYRLNVFGFLSLNSEEVPGNQGLRDQLTLLRWVQRNARSFGGDPDNVTIMGQSAGASSAHLLSLSKACSEEKLFKRLILMSGTATSDYFTTSPVYAKTIATLFLSYLGINSTDPSEIHRQLIQLPLLDIMKANTIVQNDYGLLTFVPVEEEQEFPGATMMLDGSPSELVAKGRGKDYPTMMGFTNKETESFRWLLTVINMLQRVKDNPAALVSATQSFTLTPDQLTSIIQKASDKCFNGGTQTLDKIMNYLDYLFFKYSAIKVAQSRSKDAPVYLYKFSYNSEWSVIKQALWLTYNGASHIEDLTFVFKANSMLGDYVSIPPKNNDDRMKAWMTSFVANFMRCSNPTCKEDDSNWPRLQGNITQYQSISEPDVFHLSELSAEELDMVTFLDSLQI